MAAGFPTFAVPSLMSLVFDQRKTLPIHRVISLTKNRNHVPESTDDIGSLLSQCHNRRLWRIHMTVNPPRTLFSTWMGGHPQRVGHW